MTDFLRKFQNFKHSILNLFFLKKIEKLNNYRSYIQTIIERSDLSDLQKKSAIIKIMKVLSLNIQNELVEELLRSPYGIAPLASNPLSIQCPACFFHTDYTSSCIEDLHYIFRLNTVPTITSLWNPDRMLGAFSTIGVLVDNQFKYDEKNHFSNMFIYPIGLVLIANGNHSSTAGIYDSNANLPLQECIDISSFYRNVTFDGVSFIHNECGHTLYKPEHKDIGIIYEVGRLLLENNLAILPSDIAK